MTRCAPAGWWRDSTRAIPLVLAITFVVMYYAGVGLHKISLFADGAMSMPTLAGTLITAVGFLSSARR